MLTAPDVEDCATTVRLLAAGDGWRVSDIVCRSGPEDAAFEEAHEWMSVSAIMAGTFAYRSTQGRSLMTPGSILLGNQGASFCCSHEHGVGDRCVAFHFEVPVIEAVATDLRGLKRIAFPRHRLPPQDSLAPLLAEVRALITGSDSNCAEEVALRMAGVALRAGLEVDDVPVSMSDEARAAAAVALIETAYDEPLSLACMAEAVGLGRYHFIRVFRRVVGTTPYAYLLNTRLRAAADALRRGSDVLDAMAAAGFEDLSEFTRRFGRKFGQSPGTYRRSASNPGLGRSTTPSRSHRPA